jgi:hypothetical protein
MILCLCGVIIVLSFIVTCLATLTLFFYYWTVLTGWLGSILGTIVAVLASPAVVIFPLAYWLVQGAFPMFYFELFGAMVLSMFAIAGAVMVSGFFLDD